MVHNTLALDLLIVAAGGILVGAYMVFSYIALKRGSKLESNLSKGFALTALSIGIISALMTLHMFIFKPIPSHYVELFGIGLGIYSLLFIAGGLALYVGNDLRVISYLAAIGGLLMLQAANATLSFSLTRNPSLTATLFILSALAAFSLVASTHTKTGTKPWKVATIVVAVLAISMGIIALFIGVNAYYGHIARAVAAAKG